MSVPQWWNRLNIVAVVVNGLNNFSDDGQHSILAIQLGQELDNEENLLENKKK